MYSKFYAFLFFSIFTVSTLSLNAQNLQVHYDLGKDRQMVTSTFELFKVDKYGSTYTLFDIDYGKKSSGINGLDLAYIEIARSFKFSKSSPLEARVEYNGGMGRFFDGTTKQSFGITQGFLAGVQYTWNSKDFSKIFTLQGNFKQLLRENAVDHHKNQASYQITGVWALNFFENKLTVSGFADFWGEKQYINNKIQKTVFLSEPQIWFNLNKLFSVGGEVEFSNYFGAYDGFQTNPTLGVKWNI